MKPDAASPRPLPRSSRSRTRAVVLGLLILLCGMVIGSGLTLKILWDRVLYASEHPGQAPRRITERLQKRLDLTDAQAQAVRAVSTRRYMALESIRREIRPQVEAEFETLRAEVEAVLDEEQGRRWNEMYRAMQERWLKPLEEETK